MVRRILHIAIIGLLIVGTIRCSLFQEAGLASDTGYAKVFVTGAEEEELEYHNVEFVQTIFSDPKSSQSSINIVLGKLNESETVLQLGLLEANNATGFEVERTYQKDNDPNTSTYFTLVYASERTNYTLNSVSKEISLISFHRINEIYVEGDFEVNLESFDGQEIKLTGTFAAIGETFRY